MNHYASEVIARDRYDHLRQEAAGGQRRAFFRTGAPASPSIRLRARLRTLGLHLRSRGLPGPDLGPYQADVYPVTEHT